ncbi:MAG: hypothetical protein M1309_02350 [Actinobacteria bacterium]|nr:hypothetical protein [Actinomycetota bacterium]
MEASRIQEEGSWYQESMPRSAVGEFRKRISGGAIVAGALVALALELLFVAFGSFLGVGAASVASLTGLNGILTSVGIWVAVSAAGATFLGALVAAALEKTPVSLNGLWQGLTTWGLLIVAGITLGILGFTGILGFGINATSLINAYVPNVTAITPGDFSLAGSIASTMNGWFLVGAIASLFTAVFGGLVGASMNMRMRGEEVPMGQEKVRPEEYRRAA